MRHDTFTRLVGVGAFLAIGLLAQPAAEAATAGPFPPPVANPNAPACTTNTLAYYAQNYGGLNGCSIGIATFFGFTVGAFTGTNATANDITIAPVLATTAALPPTLSFVGAPAFFHLTSGTSTFNFSYDVDPPIDILGLRLDDAPFSGGASVQETACIADAANTNRCATSQTLGISSANPNASTSFGPTHFVALDTLITLNGPATIDNFSESALVAAAVPEPGVLALGGLGGLAAFVGLRRRKRAG